MTEEIRELIEKFALQNAVKYRSAPNHGAVMGKLMGERRISGPGPGDSSAHNQRVK